MAIATRISNETYERLALAEPDRKWELWDGQPREKPGMTYAHNESAYRLGFTLGTQLDMSYGMRMNTGPARRRTLTPPPPLSLCAEERGATGDARAHPTLHPQSVSEYRVRVDAGRVHRPGSTYFIPDVFVFPVAYVTPRLRRDDVLEVYDQPLPFVAEVWSRSTGDYDRTEKFAAYQHRGDREIWFLRPYERTLTTLRHQPDGTYTETVYTGGIVPVLSLPGVAIDLDALFDV